MTIDKIEFGRKLDFEKLLKENTFEAFQVGNIQIKLSIIQSFFGGRGLMMKIFTPKILTSKILTLKILTLKILTMKIFTPKIV